MCFILLLGMSFPSLSKCLLNLAAPSDISVLETEIKRLKRAYRQIECEIIIHPMPARRAIRQDSLDDHIDGEVVRFEGFSDVVPSFIKVTPAMTLMNVYAYSKHPEHAPISWQTLHNYRIATVRGYVAIEQHLKNHTDNTTLTHATQVIQLLEKDRVELIVLPEPLALFNDKNIQQVSPPLLSEPLYHFLHQRNQHLIAPLSQALQAEFALEQGLSIK